MKSKYLTVLFLSGVCFLQARDHSQLSTLESVDIDIHNQTVVITPADDPGQVVRISASLDLRIDDELVDTKRRQRKLLKEYYSTVLAMHDLGARMGVEGAKVGAQARAVAYNALLQVADSFSREPHYYADYRFDTPQSLENMGTALTEMGAEMERLGHKLESAHIRLKRIVPALKRLGWF